MNWLHRIATLAIVAIAVLVAPSSRAQPVLIGNVIEFGRGAEVLFGSDASAFRPLLRFASGNSITPGPSLMEIGQDGSIEFYNQATIDFARFTDERIQPTGIRGWVAVRVAGEFVILPAFRFVVAQP